MTKCIIVYLVLITFLHADLIRIPNGMSNSSIIPDGVDGDTDPTLINPLNADDETKSDNAKHFNLSVLNSNSFTSFNEGNDHNGGSNEFSGNNLLPSTNYQGD
jgi:hypothetical protein